MGRDRAAVRFIKTCLIYILPPKLTATYEDSQTAPKSRRILTFPHAKEHLKVQRTTHHSPQCTTILSPVCECDQDACFFDTDELSDSILILPLFSIFCFLSSSYVEITSQHHSLVIYINQSRQRPGNIEDEEPTTKQVVKSCLSFLHCRIFFTLCSIPI